MLRLSVTRPCDCEEPCDDDGRVYLELETVQFLKEELENVMPHSLYTDRDRACLLDQLRPRDEHGLGDGDLFQDHQVSPLAAFMYATGLSKIRSQADFEVFRSRMREWKSIPVEKKLFEFFGACTKDRIIALMSQLVTQSWHFTVEDGAFGHPIPLLSDEEFNNTLIQGIAT